MLHVCCAPCSVAIIDEMRERHDLTVLFYNPNIHPLKEYEKRKAEVVRVCRDWGIGMADMDRDAEAWERRVDGVRQQKEGGARCSACIRLRLERAADFAREHGFGSYATSLSSGRRKDASVINAIGRASGGARGVFFYDEDWKKGGRQEKAERLIFEKNIYRQDYCGCRYSLAERDGRAVPEEYSSAAGRFRSER